MSAASPGAVENSWSLIVTQGPKRMGGEEGLRLEELIARDHFEPQCIPDRDKRPRRIHLTPLSPLFQIDHDSSSLV